MTEAVPAWLQAWREGRTAPAQPREPASQGGHGGSGSTPAVAARCAPARPKGNYQGFVIPDPWPNDGGKRREAVLDCDHMPPRVVRHVGWRPCMCCRKQFWSEDTARVRLCDYCRTFR